MGEKINSDEVVQRKKIYEHSKFIMASYGCRELFSNTVVQAFGFMVFFFYEVVIGLNVILAALAFVIYSIWNAINDPLIGYLTERFHMPWEKKWNLRRFPWIVLGAFPWLLSFLLIFMVPPQWDPVANPNDNWPVFLWFLVTICIYDTTNSIYEVNVLGVYPDKFQDLDERRTVQGFGTILGMIELVLSAIIPPMLISTAVRETYQNAAFVILGFSAIFFLFMLPGVMEDKRLRELNRKSRQILKDEKPESFFKMAKSTIKNKNFMAKVALFFGYQVGVVMLQFSAFYIVTYILDEDASVLTYLLGSMLIGGLISVPLWVILSHRINNNKKLSAIGAIIMFFTFIPMIFLSSNLWSWIIVLILFGIGLGGQWFSDPPTLGDVIDDAAVRTGKKQPGIYFGYQGFFFKLGHSSVAITIAIVHTLTGFVGGAPSLAELKARSPTPELALFGIRIHAAIVPAILILIALIIFWKFYDLTPDKVALNKAKLKELGI